jgi:hypothetical protein
MWIATQDDHAARVGLVGYGEASECRCEHFEDAHGMSNAASRANQGTRVHCVATPPGARAPELYSGLPIFYG